MIKYIPASLWDRLAFCYFDADFFLKACGKGFVNLFGFSDSSEAKEKFFDVLTYFGSREMRSNIARAFKEGSSDFELYFEPPNNKPMYLDITLTRESDDIVFCQAVDVTHYSEALNSALLHEEESRSKIIEANKRATLLLHNMPIACGLLDDNYEIIDFNRSAVELFALKEDEPLSYTSPKTGEYYSCNIGCDKCNNRKNIQECTAHKCLIENWKFTIPNYAEDPDAWVAARPSFFNRILEQGSLTINADRISFYGEPIFCEITVVPVEYNNSVGFALYLRDLRETKLREAAEKESHEKTQFLARMSHELRTPLNAILGISDIELRKSIHPSETEEALKRIYNASNMLQQIINDILDLSKAEAGKMNIVPVEYSISDVVIDTVQINLINIGSKRINFQLTIDEDMPRVMYGDDLRLRQLLNNMLSNAIKYTKEGRVSLTLNAKKIPKSSRIMLIIRVEDTGQGMSREQLASLFEKEYVRFNIKSNQNIEGSGLGMSIVYHLINLMGGSINVESNLGKGSIFTIYLPQEAASDDVIGREAAKKLQSIESVKHLYKRFPDVNRIQMPYGSVLVVDDVESNLFVATGMLLPYGLTIETASSGKDAINLIKSGKEYGIIFMDHMMPELDGIEATRQIKALGYKKPIVALTANIVLGQEEIFIEAGFDGYISKPIDVKKLDKYLNALIRDKQPDEVLAANPVIASSGFIEKTNEVSAALIASFLRDARRVIESINSVVDKSDYSDVSLKLYEVNAHAIKSALANIHETELSNVAYTLEVAGRGKDIKTINALTPDFLFKLHRVVVKLTPKEEPDVSDEDPEFLETQLKTLYDACERYNRRDAKAALNLLHKKTWSKATNYKLKRISELLLHSEFEEITQLLGK